MKMLGSIQIPTAKIIEQLTSLILGIEKSFFVASLGAFTDFALSEKKNQHIS